MQSDWDISTATTPSEPTFETSLITLSPFISTWKIQTQVIGALNALDASNIVLVYSDKKPVSCLGACPSGSMSHRNPLRIEGFKSSSTPPRYIVSAFYYKNPILFIDSTLPMSAEEAISGMIEVLIQELEMIMEMGEPKSPVKKVKRIRGNKHKKGEHLMKGQ